MLQLGEFTLLQADLVPYFLRRIHPTLTTQLQILSVVKTIKIE